MSETVNLQLPLIEAAQSQKHVTHNEALAVIDAAVQLAVLSRVLAAPPGSPAQGDRYLVAAAPSGAWAGHAGDLAYFLDGAWRFAAPRAGWTLWCVAEAKFLIFNGASWNELGAPSELQNLALLGVNATADSANKLTVSSAAVLLNHAGAGMQLKLNKNAAADTGSILFQDGFSGRAEFGLAGSDDFSVKVSPDGSSWTDSIVINRTTGVVDFPAGYTPAGGGGGSGDVAGPASAGDNAIARFDGTTGKLLQNGIVLIDDAGIVALPEAAIPAAPASGKLALFALTRAGLTAPAARPPLGRAAALQRHFASGKLGWWNPAGNSATVPGVVGLAAVTALGTATARNVAATSLVTRLRRLGYVSSTTAGSFAGHYATAAQFSIGAGGGLGGFVYVCRFVVSDAATVAGARMFVGLRNAVTAPANAEPNTQTNGVGVAGLSTSNNLHVVSGGSAAQAAIDLGANFPANSLGADAYELTLHAPADSPVIHYRVERLNTGHVAEGVLNGTPGTQFPAATTFLAHAAWRCNNAAALACGLDVVAVAVETDF